MVRLSSARLPFSLSPGAAVVPPSLPPPPVTTRHRGWGFPIIRPHVEPRPRVARRMHAAPQIRLQLSSGAIDAQIARESAGAALQLRASAVVSFHANDSDLMELYLLGILTLDEYLLLADE